jgi:hypothetical protein
VSGGITQTTGGDDDHGSTAGGTTGGTTGSTSA